MDSQSLMYVFIGLSIGVIGVGVTVKGGIPRPRLGMILIVVGVVVGVYGAYVGMSDSVKALLGDVSEFKWGFIWGSLCTLLAFVAIYLAVQIFQRLNVRRNPNGKQPAPLGFEEFLTEATKEPDAVDDAERVIISVTPDALWSQFNDRLDIHAQKLLGIYVGKWMKVSGKIGNIEDAFRRGHLLVRIEGSAYRSGRSISAEFHQQRFIDRLMVMRPGDQIKVLGQVRKVDVLHISLERCELL